MKKFLGAFLWLSFSAVLSFGMVACTSKPAEKQSVPPTVRGVAVMRVVPQSVEATIAETGTVQAEQAALLAPQVMGVVTAVYATEGTRVAQGQLLARINPAQPQAGVEQAKAGLSAAQHEVNAAQSAQELAASTMQRYELLHDRKSVSPHEYDEIRQQFQAANARLDVAKAAVEQAKAAVTQSQTQLSYTRIRAPFSGIVTQRMVDPGALATPGMPVFAVESAGRYRLAASVDETNAPLLHAGMHVPITVDAVSPSPLMGTLTQIYPAADAGSHSVTVKIDLPPNPALRSGMFGRADFPYGKKNVLLIPQTSIVHEGNLAAVYLVGPDQIAQIHYITVGNKVGNSIEVLSGIHDGETIVTAPDNRELGGKRIEVNP